MLSNAQLDPIECTSQGGNCKSSAECSTGKYCWIAPPAMPGGQGATSGKCIPNGSFCTPPPQSMGGNGGNGPINQDQECNGKPKPTGCIQGIECRDVTGGPISAGQNPTYAWQCKEWPQVLGGDSKEAPKKCPAGQTLLSDGKTCSDCGGTLAPNKPELRTVDGIKNWWEASKNQIAKKPIVQPLPAGPSISGFAGILPGGSQCVWVYENLEWGAYFDCINTSQAGTLAGQQKECFAQKPKGAPDVRGHFDCDNKKANVFDALWGFLTHRKPY